MPICRGCGNKEYFYAVEKVYTRFRFDPENPEETCSEDSEIIEYIDEKPEFECGECNKMDIAEGDDAKDIPISKNEFIKGNTKLTNKPATLTSGM